MAWLLGLLKAIGANVAVIVSLSSMMIAALSLYFTINAQKNDLEYKEIAIMPRPTLAPFSEDMSLSIRNLGLGPAVVQQIDFEENGKCFSSFGKTPAAWQQLYEPFLKTLAASIFSKSLPDMPWSKGGRKRYDFEVDLLQYQDTVRANEDRWLFRLDAGTLKDYREIDSSVQVAARNKFFALAYAAPIVIVMCSATGRTCMSVGDVPKACAGHFQSELAE